MRVEFKIDPTARRGLRNPEIVSIDPLISSPWPAAVIGIASDWLYGEARDGRFTAAAIEVYDGSQPLDWRWMWMSGGREP